MLSYYDLITYDTSGGDGIYRAGIQTEDFHINSLDSRFRGNDGILLFGESLIVFLGQFHRER